jgi:hypothetical protein
MGPIHGLLHYTHYVTIIFYYTYYFIYWNWHLGVYSLQKIANWHIHHGGSASIQSKSIRNLIINLQRAVSHDIRLSNRAIGIGLTMYTSQALRNSGLNLSPNPLILAAMAVRFSCQT